MWLAHSGAPFVRRVRLLYLGTAIVLLAAVVNGLGGVETKRAHAAASVAQTYYTPFEAQAYIDILRGIALTLDDGDVWMQTSVVPIDQPDYADGDFGFSPGEESLPQTGIDADRLLGAAAVSLILGMTLLALGHGLERRRRFGLALDRLPR